MLSKLKNFKSAKSRYTSGKKLILSLVTISTISLSSLGQAPEGFKYQAVVRDAGNTILNNQTVGMRMTIQQGSIGGTIVYQETFSPTTNVYGLVNLEIGNGTIVSGDFNSINWANGPYFIETAVDVTGGTSYAVMGTSQLMSVPYALHAKTAENVINDQVDDADADPTNEIETWSTLSGIPVDISDGDDVDDADNDPTNELQTWANLPGIPNMIKTMQNGEQYVGASGGGELVIVAVTFPISFITTPRVLCTANTEVGTIYDDSFNVTIREVTTTGFVMIVNRVDGSTWGQNMTVNWMAFEP